MQSPGKRANRSKHIALELSLLNKLDHYFDIYIYAILKTIILNLIKAKLKDEELTVKVFILTREPVKGHSYSHECKSGTRMKPRKKF